MPLGAGLALIAVGWALPRPVASTVGLVTLLGLGAVIPERPWRTAALTASPSLVASLVHATGESAASVGLVVLLSPLLVAFATLVIMGGRLLVGHQPDAAPPVESADDFGRRWKPFETKAQRGRFLVIVAILVVVGSGFLSRCGSAEADRDASRRAEEIRTALNGRSPQSLQSSLGIDLVLPGGPYRFATVVGDSFEATAEVNSGFQYRCILVRVGPDGRVSTEIKHKRCSG